MRVKSLRNVHFHGRVAGVEKHRLFSLCNVSCLPTYYPEGLPVSLLEGSSYGHYIISTKNAGIVDATSRTWVCFWISMIGKAWNRQSLICQQNQ